MILTKSQKKAAQYLSGNILVSAGAGTGKTRVLIERILYILKNQKADISDLLVLTFTEKAANEIKSRLSAALHALGLERTRRELELAAIGTFHSFASRLLKEHPIETVVDPDFRVLGAEEEELLKDETLTGIIEKSFQNGDPSFELLRLYGEQSMRAGLLKTFAAARQEGKSLRDFFDKSRENKNSVLVKANLETINDILETTARLEGAVDSGALDKFLKKKDWDWKAVEDFRAWCMPYMRGGKKALASEWKRWRELVKEFAAIKMEKIAEPWLEKFEALAIEFESAYEAAKREENLLDFDDLQIKAVKLFESPQPALQKLSEGYRKRFAYILVDEFQDTNYLQTRFIELLSSGNNVFVVGDYKQSIYAFRGAEPRIFFDREKNYEKGEGGVKVALLDNFRSSVPLLESLNGFFKELWDEDRFPFEPLVAKASQDLENRKAPPVEILATSIGEEEEKEHARMREAIAIAGRIKELHEKENVPYGNMAVLFQVMTLSGIYEYALKGFGIPYFITAGRGFYYQPEIRDMVSFLTYLERPLLDISLAAALRSPFFHVTDDTLFWLARYAKAGDEKAPLAHALKEIEKIPEIEASQQKTLRNFIALTEKLRQLKDRVSLAELMDAILEKTGYELAVLADHGGPRRYANLKKLMTIARESESYERMPLARFLAILKQYQIQEIRESEAQVSTEKGSDAVRLMTVHAAKGLEFPVVIVADMGLEGFRSGSKAIVAHANDGYAIRLLCGADKKEEKPYFYQRLDQTMKVVEDEEWKRLFYVACTRAKSRLILSGVHKKKEKPIDRYGDMSTWMDWAMALGEKFGLPITHDLDKTMGFAGRQISDVRGKIEKILREIEAKAPESSAAPERASEKPVLRSIDLPVSAYVLFEKDPRAFWKTYQIGWSVSDREFEDTARDTEEESIPACDFGTAMHAFLERLDLKDPEKYLEQDVLERIFSAFSKNAIIEARKILKGFFKSPIFKRLQRARRVLRETDFTMNGRHGLIHGKLDVLFEDEKGEWHILDYKTAVGDEASAKESAYTLQIEIYALAARKILGLPIRSGIVYYLKNGSEVVTEFPGGEKTDSHFDTIEKQVFDFQQNILNFYNEKLLQTKS